MDAFTVHCKGFSFRIRTILSRSQINDLLCKLNPLKRYPRCDPLDTIWLPIICIITLQHSGVVGEGGGSSIRNRIGFLELKTKYFRRPVAAGRYEAQGASDIEIRDDG